MDFWEMVEEYVDRTGATEASIQRRAGLGKGTFTSWRARGIPVMPAHEAVVGLADALHRPYREVVDGLLEAGLYLPEDAARDLAQSLRAREAKFMNALAAFLRQKLEANQGNVDLTRAAIKRMGRGAGIGEARLLTNARAYLDGRLSNEAFDVAGIAPPLPDDQLDHAIAARRSTKHPPKGQRQQDPD